MRLLRALLLMAVLCAAGAASAPAATYTWIGGSGSYTYTAHWSASPAAPGTLPGSSDDVVIAGTTDFTVNYVGPPGVQRSVASLTLGGTVSGTQTLLIKTANGTGDGRLEVSGATTITSHAQVIIDQDSTGLPSPGNTPQLNFGGPASNAGLIVARNEGAADKRIASIGAGTITNTGTIQVQSGQFEVKHIVNSGTIAVDAGGELFVNLGSQAIAVTQNGGTVTNNGVITINNSGWAQNGGTLTGNPVRILTGQLADSAGTGSFVVMGNGNKISGKVPAGQTVQFGSPAEEQSNFMNIQAGGFTVEEGGTLVLAPPPANGVEVLDNPLTVNGTLVVKATNTHAIVGGGGFTVGAAGTVDVQVGQLLLRGTTVNHGAISVAPGATVQLASSAPAPFTSDGVLNFQIASPSSFGTITRQGGESAALGGTANGVLVGGYVPAAGTAFKVVNALFSGAFATVGGGFAAQYAADKLSASLVYAGVPAGGGGGGGTPGGGGGTPPPGNGGPKTVVRCVVPNLKNKTLKSATSALKRAHCALGTVTRPKGRNARKAATRVVAQTKKAGTKLARNTKIGVTMGKPATHRSKARHKPKAKHKR
jgi:hypothetical protein